VEEEKKRKKEEAERIKEEKRKYVSGSSIWRDLLRPALSIELRMGLRVPFCFRGIS
jgi:hypothetical protein